jgi:hypothetical protein
MRMLRCAAEGSQTVNRPAIRTGSGDAIGVKEAASFPKGPSMTNRSTSADFVTAFATGWPENQPDLMIVSLTTAKGVQDFAINKSQALLIAKTIKETAAKLAEPRQS